MNKLKLGKNGQSEPGAKFFYINLVIVVAFSLIFARLWYLQIIKGDFYKEQSENNRVRIQEIIAPRGILFDREGIPLVDSFPSFDVSLFRQDVPDLNGLVPILSRALSMEPERLQARLEAARSLPSAQPLKLKADISRRELAMIETRRLDLPGVMVDMVIRRNYPYGRLASHLIGYLGEISERELERAEFHRHKMGYIIGKYGIEREFELELMGTHGGRKYEVNARGRKMRVLGTVEPNPGNNLHLTIHLELQKTVEMALGDRRGAIVVMDPQNGDILAMTSKPDFDPNLFARGISPENWKSIVENPARPLQNRAIQGQYPPGSVHKILTTIAALEEKVINPETTFQCTGIFPFGNRDYHCWKKEGHGRMNLRQAIIESCDIYFYQVGLRLGVDRLAKYAAEFGLGKTTGIVLANEKPGLIPSSSWKMKRYGIPWQLGETLSTAIGQGYNLTTPLQIAAMVSAVANGGILYRPRIVRVIQAAHGEMVREFPAEISRTIHVSEETLAFVREALWAAVNAPNGTGWRARVPGLDVAGKTGTAQVVQRREGRQFPSAPDLEDHAWFACFAPARNPQVTVVVLVEHGGGGGSTAAPIARKVVEKFFELQRSAPPSHAPLKYAAQPSFEDSRNP
jgi:penicillin-binding protein 2